MKDPDQDAKYRELLAQQTNAHKDTGKEGERTATCSGPVRTPSGTPGSRSAPTGSGTTRPDHSTTKTTNERGPS